MSKKTAIKKKPVNVRDIHPTTLKALNKMGQARHDTLIVFVRALQSSVDMLGQRIDAMRHEQVALSQESRSAPAEEVDGLGVFPKHQPGDLVIHVLVGGALHTVREVAQQGLMVYLDSDPGCVPAGWYRKPTEAEVASHKAKEQVWTPKVDDWVAIEKTGKVSFVSSIESNSGLKYFVLGEKGVDGKWLLESLRGVSHQEISAYVKAKEEQRTKEAGWAKFDVLQEGDACRASYEEVCRLMKLATDGGLKGNIVYRSAIGIYLHGTYGIHQVDGGFIEEQTYPIAEWERRLQGTIAKRAEDERAKDLAKPLEFGTRVKMGDHDTVLRIACFHADEHGHWRVHQEGHGPHATRLAKRHEFTIID